MSLLFIICVSTIASPATSGPWSGAVKKQKKQNADWLKQAKARQARDFKKADQLLKEKEYARAEILYRRVVRATYREWTFRKAITPAIGTTKEREVVVPTNKVVHRKLKTSYTKKAKARLDQMRLMVVENGIKELLSSADKLASEGHSIEAYLVYLEVAGTSLPRKLSRKYHKQANDKATKIVEAALALLNEVEELVTGGKFEDAKKKMMGFGDQYGDFKESPAVLARYRELLKNPKLGEMEHELLAAKHLKKALELVEKREFAEGMRQLGFVAEAYYDTDAGKEAAKKLRELRADQGIQGMLTDAKAKEECHKWLEFAKNFESNGRYDEAAKLYKRIMEQYPGTTWATEAKERLEQLRTDNRE